jgi:hypothetical protein
MHPLSSGLYANTTIKVLPLPAYTTCQLAISITPIPQLISSVALQARILVTLLSTGLLARESPAQVVLNRNLMANRMRS